jgi:hypothetical protein
MLANKTSAMISMLAGMQQISPLNLVQQFVP